ncbi:MAG TPA: ABC transporter substrate-binding protein [Xanthobacteraceae bacterium]|nr:ABC transporter substrate-binding protein [Xanthobacteraceae bacterium]
MRRREFLGVLGGMAAGWPASARAQQTMPVIGYVSGRSLEYEERLLSSFRKGLEEEGYAAGRNVAVQYRFSDGDDSRLAAIAADFVRRQVAVIVASGPSAVAVKGATSTIPIVFSSGADPVGQGLVASLSRPGGNATGVAVFTNELGPKRLELLRELAPKAGLIAFVVNPHSTTTAAQVKDIQTAAAALGQKIVVVNASTPEEVEQAFPTIAQEKAGAVLYSAHQFYQIVRDQLVALAARHRLPAMYEWREFVEAGGLASYSTSRNDSFRQMGVYTGQILKGAKPSELPVVQPTKFELVINLTTAKALGLEVSAKLLALSDEVIE